MAKIRDVKIKNHVTLLATGLSKEVTNANSLKTTRLDLWLSAPPLRDGLALSLRLFIQVSYAPSALI